MFDIFIKKLNLLSWLGFKGKPRAVRKPHGHTRTTGPHGEIVDADTLQCCHCQAHFEVVVGSGRLRGFCRRCMGYTCGGPWCMVCITKEQRLENQDAGLPPMTIPTAVQIPTSMKGGVILTPRPPETETS